LTRYTTKWYIPTIKNPPKSKKPEGPPPEISGKRAFQEKLFEAMPFLEESEA
jgi:hypothetical protein